MFKLSFCRFDPDMTISIQLCPLLYAHRVRKIEEGKVFAV